MSDEYCYLTIVSGPRAGTNFLLDPSRVNRLGRGIDCDVVLTDPLCSRVHAELSFTPEGWEFSDASSRNGSYVDDERIDRVILQPEQRVRVGSSEFTFCRADQPPTLAIAPEESSTEAIVREAPVDSEDSGRIALAALRSNNNANELLVLFELSLNLLSCDQPHDVLRMTLDRLHRRTNAEVVGFLWVDDDGALKPQMHVPLEAHGDARLSESLTKIVIKQRRAVWVANQSSAASSESLRPYADAVCVPVIDGTQTIGAIHLYLGQGRFKDIDFEFAISAAQLLGVALTRSRRQASLVAEHRRLAASSAACAELVGESKAMKKLKDKIRKLAPAQGSVLIVGESGSGKELVAGAIHQASSRADRPMLAVNCAAIPQNLIESQLFGHVKGAFTGATKDHSGWFEQADTGTLFLDEIGELPLEAQATLLRILEGHAFLPVGGTVEITVDVRILAATNRDLNELVRERKFREDLYYRLSVFELRVPPLRERDKDVELLMDHFLDHFRRRHGRLDLKLDDKARLRMVEYGWPGNVRQLRNVIDSAVVMASGNAIEAEDLGLYDAGPATEDLDSLKISDWEQKLIVKALRRAGGNVPEAAKLLGIGRATLYRKIDDYNIDR